MQIQEIITYLVVAVAIGFVMYSLYKTLSHSQQNNHTGCSSGCNCDAKVVRKELLSRKKSV
jgi:uncharacterized membrane-anchored protein